MVTTIDRDRLLRELLIEIACDRIGGQRFNDLLIATGIYLDDIEWDTANRILGRAAPLTDWVEDSRIPC